MGGDRTVGGIASIGMIVERVSPGCLLFSWRVTCRDWLVVQRALCQHIEQEHAASRKAEMAAP